MPAIPIKIKAKRKIMHKVIFFMGPVYNGSCTRRPIATGTGTKRIEIDCQYLVHTSTHVFAHDDRFAVREASQLRRLYSFVTNRPDTFRDNLLSPMLNDRNFLREEKIFCWRSNFNVSST